MNTAPERLGWGLFALILALWAPLAHGAAGDRLLRWFDFDERKFNNPEDLPMHWEKAEGPGLPHYVTGQMVSDVGRQSGHAFRMDLNGGSVTYRTQILTPQEAEAAATAGLPNAGAVPVVRGTAYRIEAWVKTTPLENARARLAAYFVDKDGIQLPASLRVSDPYHGTGLSAEWHPLTLELKADDRKAAYLVVEMGLLQPVLYAPASILGQRTLFKEDVTGSAWFTDIAISQVPEVAVNTDVPGNVFPRGTPVRLWLTVQDADKDDLTMRVEVRNAVGELVHQRTGPLQEGIKDGHLIPVLVPALPAGWYRCEVALASSSTNGREVARERQAFIQLADDGKVITPDPRFGVIATQLTPSQWTALPTLLPMLGAGRVKVAVWGEGVDIQTGDSRAFEKLLEQLQNESIIPTGVITGLPPAIASQAGTSSLARLPRLDEALWKPRLSYLIAQHANHLDRWQLGLDGEQQFATDPAFRRAYDTVFAAFSGLVHDPDVAIPWPASFETDSKLPSTVAITLPADISPAQVPMYVQDTKARGGQKLSLTMLPMDGRFGREARLEDFGQRYVTALASGAERLDLPLPFDRAGQPEELLLAMRTLNQTLAGAAYRGKINLSAFVEAYLFERKGVGIVALWSTLSDETQVDVRMNLGGKPARIDLTGTSTPLRQALDATEPGEIKIKVGKQVTLVDGVSGAVALFRTSVVVDNPMLESSPKPHTRRLSFTNTFPEFISGTVKLIGPEGWTLTPPTMTFSLNPGETFTREVTIELPYNTLAGTRALAAKFDIPGIKPQAFSIPIDLKLGLNEVGMQTVATREGNETVVQMLITNHGQQTISYTAFALFPNQPRQERLVTNLGPGQTAVKRFRFPASPPDTATGRATKVRVGLRELEGTKMLNDEILVP